MSSSDPLYPWLVLANAPGLGPKTLDRLLQRFASPSEIAGAGRRELTAVGLDPAVAAAIEAPDKALIEATLAWAEQGQAAILTRDDPRYPARLAAIDDAPFILYVYGHSDTLNDPQLAIVGSRSPTPQGLAITRALARRFAGDGLTITSGLASGIDGAAHEGALEAGRTLAVLGTGPDRVYPASHRGLAERIAASGALVTEYPPGVGPRAGHFPRRNRLISGLSLGTLVTEAAQRSGSLITARLAAEQGREVFAVPGSIRNPRARGCHALIRQGAKLVETADDVLVELLPQLADIVAPPRQPEALPSAGGTGASLDEDCLRLLACMGYDPIAPDELIARSGLPAANVGSMLLLLELQGHVSSCPGGRYCREAGVGAQPGHCV